LIFGKKESTLLLRGGTNAENAPQIDYFTMVFLPLATKFGINVECEIHKRGYYPQGRGEVYLKVHSIDHLKPIQMIEFGKLKRFYARSFVAGFLNVKIAERMSETVREKLEHRYPNVPYEADIVKEPQHNHVGAGTGIIVIAETTTGCLIAGSALGKKGVPAEQVGLEAVDSLLEDLKCEACVDQYMQDQLIIFMSLAAGISRIKTGPLTLHTRTAIFYAELLTGVKFKIDAPNKDYCIIECEGIGHERQKSINLDNY
jgi:RNA 3'-terminal phosphate cyclase (ATP)